MIILDMDNTTPQTEDKEVIVGKYKIKVIRDLCIGAASCVAVSPATFELDGENKAITLQGNDTPENILMAAQSCPTKAIIVIDTETNAQVWPA
jgi:ferredoxin